jgi:hypothetical protein
MLPLSSGLKRVASRIGSIIEASYKENDGEIQGEEVEKGA